MKQILIIAVFFSAFLVESSVARRLSDYSVYDFDVRFTNPVCRVYRYNDNLLSNDGVRVRQKPKNAYCSSTDAEASAARAESVQYKLIEWIRSAETKEIFFSSLSFSNATIRAELCEAAKRGVKIRFVLDSNTSLTQADQLTSCTSSERQVVSPEYRLRGAGRGTGYSHNKFFIFNPAEKGAIRIIFASGNVSSGTALHHESWNFLKTHTDSHLAQKQLCLMSALWDTVDSSKTAFRNNFNSCVSQIREPEESDIQLYVVPLEGDQAVDRLTRTLGRSRRAWVTAHRFSLKPLMDSLASRLNSRRNLPVRFIGDDDLYWANRENFTDNRNTRSEWNNVNRLMNLGMEARFLETNHWAYIYQHNRMVIMDRDLLIGSANWTGSGLSRNFESLYWVRIPQVVRAYANQFEHLWGLSTEMGDLPRRNVLPR